MASDVTAFSVPHYPDAPNPAKDCHHKWGELPSRAARGSYLKRKAHSSESFADYVQDVEYTMLFCERCGRTREVIAVDKRPIQ